MVTLGQLLVLLALIWLSAYRRMRTGQALFLCAMALVIMGFIWHFTLIPWIFVGLFSLLFFADNFRKQNVTLPIFKKFKTLLPPMNDTERDALEAGDVWWDAELFRGNPDWNKLLNFPKPELSQVERDFLNQQTETLCAMLDDWKIMHEDKDLPPEAWDYIKKEGFLGMIIPKEYGGLGFSALAHSAVISKLATRSGSLSVTVMVPNSLGPSELLLHYGTEEQKQYYLPKLAKGEEIPCFALTGPEAGSDAGALTDSGIICKQEFEGKETLGIRLTWNKRYITLAPIATVLGLAFKLYDPDGLIGEEKELGITCALIPTDHPGVIIGNRHYPMGQAFMNGPTQGKDVFIPIDWIIGGIDYAGKGWRMLVECLSAGRGISLPASATATAKLCYRTTGAYAMIREQFRTPIGYFEGVEEALSRIAGNTYQMEATRIMTAGAVDLSCKPSVITAIAKYHMTEMARSVITDAMDVHGGRGVIMGEKNYLSSAYMSMPISITVEGANILTRNLMIFGQGAIRCHPFIFNEMQSASNPNETEGLNDFDHLFFRHVGYGISNFVRTLSLSLTAGKIVKKPVPGITGRYYQQLTRMSSALALVSDVSMMLLGGELKRKERLSARLGDVLSYLYLSSNVLKYYEDHGRPISDLPYVEWCLKKNLYYLEQAFIEFFENLPFRGLGKVLKWLVFPYGEQYRLPTDKLEQNIVKSMLKDNELRDRITKNTYIGDETQPVGLIESAFKKILATKETAKKIKYAIKSKDIEPSSDPQEIADSAVQKNVITPDEAKQYLDAEAARWKAIQVDDYSKAYLKQGCE